MIVSVEEFSMKAERVALLTREFGDTFVRLET